MKTIKHLLISLSLCSLFVACDKYDDTELRNRIDNIESRVEALETLCSRLNSDIASMKIVLEALENKDYVTNVTPVIEAGKTVGYTIQFSKSGAVTIYNGKDGADGKDGQNGADGKDGKDGVNGQDGITPIIGVKQDTDGIWYWTINGEWLLNNGEKVKAVGTDGKDGQDGKDGADGNTPLLRIDNDYWKISYDNGLSWQILGKAKGEDGQDGADGIDGDTLFSSVLEDEDYVYLNLTVGDTIRIPKGSGSKFSLNVEAEEIEVMTGGEIIEIGYTIDCATDKTIIRAYGQNGWFASVRPVDTSSGKIVVVAPDEIVAGEILIVACDGEKTVMVVIDCVQGEVSLASNAIMSSYTGGTFTIPVKTKIIYVVDVPDDDTIWVTDVDTKALRDETILITIAENPNMIARHCVLKVKDLKGRVIQSIAVNQDGRPVEGALEVTVNTAGTLADVMSDYDYSNIKSLKINGVLNEDDFILLSYNMPSLRELDLSKTENEIPKNAFYKSSNIEKIILPECPYGIGASAFEQSTVKEVILGPNVWQIADFAFFQCKNLSSLELPETLGTVGEFAFVDCTSLTSINIPSSVYKIGSYAFTQCSSLSSITFSPSCRLTALNDYVFESCPITEIRIPARVSTISMTAFKSCTLLQDVDFEDGCRLSLMDNYFKDCPIAKVKIPANVTKITNTAFYDKRTLKEVTFEQGSKCKEIEGVIYSTKYIDGAGAYGAFYRTGIESVTIPASVEIIGPLAFSCFKLKSVNFEEGSNLTTLTSEGLGERKYLVLYDPNYTLSGHYAGYGAFSRCKALNSIVLPKSLKHIGPETFANSGLQTVNFEEGSQLSDICELSFACTPLETIEIPSGVTTIGGAAFSCCTSLKTVSFDEDSKLADITQEIIPANRTFGAFYGCTSLTSMNFPASLKSIAGSSFCSCTSLQSLTFAENSALATIGYEGFYDCPVLHTVDMSNCNQVTQIGNNAFQSSDEIRIFKIGTVAPPTCGSTPFGAVGNYSVLKVPDGAVTQYQSASGWKDFASITGLNE